MDDALRRHRLVIRKPHGAAEGEPFVGTNMARYLIESRQQRSERRAREERGSKERDSRKNRRLLLQFRLEHIQERYGAHQAPIETTNSRTEPTSEAHNKAELISLHQQSQNDDDEERFYVIEKLLDKRSNAQGVEEYKVRWQNYPPEYDSWEPRSELEKNAIDMINAYNNIPQPELSDTKHCICKRAYAPGKGAMIQCSTCETWYHFSCIDLNLYEANCYARYHCKNCREKDSRLKCMVKKQKLHKLQGRMRMRVDTTDGTILESPPRTGN